jgi:hypothetical protein
MLRLLRYGTELTAVLRSCGGHKVQGASVNLAMLFSESKTFVFSV